MLPLRPRHQAGEEQARGTRLRQVGIVLKRLDARYLPGVRTADWRKVKTAAWRTNHGPRRLPKELREHIYR